MNATEFREQKQQLFERFQSLRSQLDRFLGAEIRQEKR